MKKLLALLLAVLMVLSLAACGSGEKGDSKDGNKNTYETPLELQMNFENEKNASKKLASVSVVFNGLCEKEYNDIDKIRDRRENYDKDKMLEFYAEQINSMKDKYGNNYKYSYKIEEKETLDKDDLKDLKDEIKDYAAKLKNLLDELENLNSDDLADLAEEMGLSKSDVTEIIKILKNVYETMKNVEVTEGYELTVTIKLTGSELDEPEEEEETIYVYKVNGRWISKENLLILNLSFLYAIDV